MSQGNDSLFEWLWAHGQDVRHANKVNSLYNDIRYNSKIRYNVNLVCSKISGSYMFSLMFPFYSPGKHTFCIFVRIASRRRF